MKSGSGEIYRDVPKNKKADCTMIIEDDNMVDMASGKLNGQQVNKSDDMINMTSSNLMVNR